MRSTILLIGAVGLFSSTVSAQVPNGGFEDWTTVGTYQDPDHWITINAQTEPFGLLSCERGTPGAVGNAYAKVTTRQLIPGNTLSTVPGFLSLGDPATGTSGYPFADRPGALNGSWQYDIQAGDQGNITIAFTRWDPVAQNPVPVGTGNIQITGTHAGWQTFSIPITYVDGSDPDSVFIVIQSSNAALMDGSTISVDDLTFGAAGAGIQEEEASVALQIYPSPATDELDLVADGPIAEASIMDITGRILMHQGVNDLHAILQVSGLITGRYLVQLRMADGRRVVRSFVKQ